MVEIAFEVSDYLSLKKLFSENGCLKVHEIKIYFGLVENPEDERPHNFLNWQNWINYLVRNTKENYALWGNWDKLAKQITPFSHKTFWYFNMMLYQLLLITQEEPGLEW